MLVAAAAVVSLLNPCVTAVLSFYAYVKKGFLIEFGTEGTNSLSTCLAWQKNVEKGKSFISGNGTKR